MTRVVPGGAPVGIVTASIVYVRPGQKEVWVGVSKLYNYNLDYELYRYFNLLPGTGPGTRVFFLF